MTRARNGKIARLPFELRTEVNRRLRDGVPGPKITAWLERDHAAELEKAGFKSIKKRSLTAWRAGGYRDWEQQQERLEAMHAQREFALQLARQSDGSLQLANVAVAESLIYEALEAFNLKDFKVKLQAKPELFSILLDGVAKLSRARVEERRIQFEFKKYQDKVAEQKRKIGAQLQKAKGGGLSPEAVRQIGEAMNLL